MPQATIELFALPSIRELTCTVVGQSFAFAITTDVFAPATITVNLEEGATVNDLVVALMGTGYFGDDPITDPEDASSEPVTMIEGIYVGSQGATTRPAMSGKASLVIPVIYTI